MVKGCNKDNHSQDPVTEVTSNTQMVVKDPNIFSPQNGHHLLPTSKIYLQQKNKKLFLCFSDTEQIEPPSHFTVLTRFLSLRGPATGAGTAEGVVTTHERGSQGRSWSQTGEGPHGGGSRRCHLVSERGSRWGHCVGDLCRLGLSDCADAGLGGGDLQEK